MVEESVGKNGQEFKFFTPIYIPVDQLESYMSKDKCSLEMQIIN